MSLSIGLLPQLILPPFLVGIPPCSATTTNTRAAQRRRNQAAEAQDGPRSTPADQPIDPNSILSSSSTSTLTPLSSSVSEAGYSADDPEQLSAPEDLFLLANVGSRRATPDPEREEVHAAPQAREHAGDAYDGDYSEPTILREELVYGYYFEDAVHLHEHQREELRRIFIRGLRRREAASDESNPSASPSPHRLPSPQISPPHSRPSSTEREHRARPPRPQPRRLLARATQDSTSTHPIPPLPPKLPARSVMALWAPHNDMPLRGERTCPQFLPDQPTSVLRYFADLEALFARAGIADDQSMKKHATYYSPSQEEYLWQELATYIDNTKTYVEFRDEVTALYGYTALQHEWTRHDLNTLLTQYKTEYFEKGFESLERYQSFYRSFSGIVSYLVTRTRTLSAGEAARILIQAFRGDTRNLMQMKLVADATYDPDKPSLDCVHKAALYALRQRAAAESGGGSGGVSRGAIPAPLLSTTPTPEASNESAIKREELDSFYVQINNNFATLTQHVATLLAQNQGGQAPAAVPVPAPLQRIPPPPPANQDARAYVQNVPWQRPPAAAYPFCFYCGIENCHSGSCPRAAEDIQAGLIRRDASNRIVLSNGQEIPRTIPGANMRARVINWHAQHPRANEDRQQGQGNQNAGPTVGGFSYTVALGNTQSYEPEWSKDALTLHLRETGGQKKSRMVFDGVYPPPLRKSVAKNVSEGATGSSAQEREPRAQTSAAQPVRQPTPGPTAERMASQPAPAQEESVSLPAASLGGDEPVHPFAKAKAVIVDVSQKPPALPARNPARGVPSVRPVMKLMDPKAIDRIQQRILDNEITVSSGDLLSISPELAKRLHEGTTVRRVMFRDPLANEGATVDRMIADLRGQHTANATTALLEELPGESSDEEEEAEAAVLAQHTAGNPTSEEVKRSEDDAVIVGRPLSSLRTVWAQIGTHPEYAECILDPGSQIVAISEGLCNHLHLVYNPANTLGMESANGIVNRSLGVVMDVPLTINGTNITLYLQMHVMRDAAYGILLGRPFDTLASTIVETSPDGVHKLTLRCPNTQRVAVVPTFNRGEGRPALPAAARPGF